MTNEQQKGGEAETEVLGGVRISSAEQDQLIGRFLGGHPMRGRSYRYRQAVDVRVE